MLTKFVQVVCVFPICLISVLPANLGFKMACLNINGLVKHFDELRVLLAEFSVVILGINETRLEESIKSSELHIPSLEFIRCDRNRHGGGAGCLH